MIHGMDWLTANHVLLNCATKTAVFGAAEPQDSRVMSAKRVRSSVKSGAQVFMILFSVALDKDSKEKDIPIVKVFSEVFADVDCFPSEKEKLSLLSVTPVFL